MTKFEKTPDTPPMKLNEPYYTFIWTKTNNNSPYKCGVWKNCFLKNKNLETCKHMFYTPVDASLKYLSFNTKYKYNIKSTNKRNILKNCKNG